MIRTEIEAKGASKIWRDNTIALKDVEKIQ